jgi:peptidoglycan hydrolase-like protein with peptidoglycan-binding domain
MLRSRYFPFVLMLMLPSLVLGAQRKSSSSKGSSASGKADSKATAATSKKAATARKTAAKKPAKRVVRRPARVPILQAKPTRARYQEIQQALADAGYYSEAVDGIWGDSSAEALKHFQKDQGLEPTGKLDALSLIRLGLGPHYDAPENASNASKPAPG